MYKRRRLLGTYLGITLAAFLPGVSLLPDGPSWAGVVLAGSIFLILAN